MLLLLRFALFVSSAVVDFNSPKDPIVILLVLGTMCICLAIWVCNSGSIYRKWYINILESSFILNLGLLSLASYHVKVEGGNQAAVAYISVAIAFLTFLGIMAYHIVQQVMDFRVWRNTVQPKLCRLQDTQRRQASIEMADSPARLTFQPVPTTFVELRESLLSSLQ